MKAAVILAIVAFAASASAQGGGGGGFGHGHGHHGHHGLHHGIGHIGIAKDIYAYPAYKYSYGVADKLTGDHKHAVEVRDGPITKGSYSLVQPDGILRTVNYISTPHGGFQAQVINKGVAGHPAIYGFHHGHHHHGLHHGHGHGHGHHGGHGGGGFGR